MKKLLQIGNGIAFIATVVVNYLSNTGWINRKTIGEVSQNLNTLFTPAGYAFAIWGLIYLLLFGFVVYQGRSLFVKVRDDGFVEKIGGWFIISCIANILWVFAWLYGYIGASLICLSLILISLLRIVMRNRMELWDAPISVIAFLWWPFVIYSGWITVASIANVAAYLQSLHWNGAGISEVYWTVSMILIATIINLLVTWRRNMREFALVGAWALVAIAVANWESQELIKIVALISAGVLLISSGLHALKNRATNPGFKLKEFIDRKKS